MKQIIIIIVIAIGVIGLGVVLFKYSNTKPADIPQVGEIMPIEGSEHIEVGADHHPYDSNPPTSGHMYGQVANPGVYNKPLADELVVHSLEHGRIWISYKESDQDTLIKLDEIARRYSKDVVLSPRENNDAPIALASWGRLQKLQTLDEQAITTFIQANKNKSPEAGM